jgi:hypothetical protein
MSATLPFLCFVYVYITFVFVFSNGVNNECLFFLQMPFPMTENQMIYNGVLELQFEFLL